ncbi:1-phosphofructokinase [Candidatus Erwinia haradaeae]|uniref:Phosphofructokinase n=1 Tax=Candidatus Erwinia haradaeae TaxID=1922217 RepID=A0A451DHV6_9GAMM|nr:1-phosphofructokinase [Candidatus Erwinia haradaeae]VFP86227.1 1-phosphofructokinase [Candidatus Erwinia haradaeae]
MSKRVATVTFNPAYDLEGYVPYLEHGELNLINTISMHAAGKGINVAKILRDLNIDVTVFGFLGNKNQDGFLCLFKKKGIINRFHLVNGYTRTNIKITECNGELTEINFSGFKVTTQEWESFFTKSRIIFNQFDILCISGSLPAGIDFSAFAYWMKQVRKYCPCIVFDSSHETFIAGLTAKPYLIKPNLRELETYIGYPLPTKEDVINTAQILRGKGIEHVVISMGAKGAILVNADGVWISQPPSCDVISTVGAGDSMVGGLIYGLLMHESSEHILRLATAISALSVNKSSVGITDHAQLSTMMKRVDLYPYSTLSSGDIL